MQSHLSSNSLSSCYSAYRIFHAAETTLFKIHNDIILAMDLGEDASLILLDLSAALVILSIIPSFSLVFKVGSAMMVFLLIGSHFISRLALSLNQ